MYQPEHATGLLVPHVLKLKPGDVQDSLVDVLDPSAIKDRLEFGIDGSLDDDIEDARSYEAEAIAASDLISTFVRDALVFPEQNDEDVAGLDFRGHGELKEYIRAISTPIPINALRKHQVASCVGFTVVTSEILQAADIDHWVGFVNNHTMVLLPTEYGRGLHWIDTLEPRINQDLQFSMVSGYGIKDDMESHDKSAVKISTKAFADNCRLDEEEVFRTQHWLRFLPNRITPTQPGEILTKTENLSDHVPSPDRVAFMTIMAPLIGRRTLIMYNEFRVAYQQANYMGAFAALTAIGDMYPDIDARRTNTEIGDILGHTAQFVHPNHMRKVLDQHYASFDLVSRDSRFPERHGDHLRLVARINRDLASAQQAAKLYERVLDYPKSYRDSVRNKLRIARALVDDIQSQTVVQ